MSSQVDDKGFAIKQQLDDLDRETFEKEAKILRMFSGTQCHPHIVSLLASYEHGGKYHLVFHRAESDLLAFWNQVVPEPICGYANILWMANQCWGIADGLRRLHKRLTFTVDQDAGVGPQRVSEGTSFHTSSMVPLSIVV